jgi:acyl-CoA oxidase
METTAVWCTKEKKFIINTPTINSQKYWITNGAYHATYGIIFAQTIINSKHEGINAFIVKLREDDKTLAKGVSIDDMGHKMALNGVDNARIILRNVKVERTDMLNKYSDIDENGKFVSSIPGKRQRFLVAANRLLSGRICIASMMLAGAKLTLLVTSKYASERLSNGKTGKSDTPINTFQIFQNQITPLIARTVVYNSALLSIRKIYSDYCINPSQYSPEAFNNIIRLCCVIKPMIAWHANEIGNICRERCGGMGYLSINRVEGMVAMAHSGITAEGDSAVLMQKVSKEYVEDFTKKIIEAPKVTEEISSIAKKDCVFNFTTLLNLIKYRETALLNVLTEKTVTNFSNLYQTWMLEESDLIQDLAMMYGERYCLEECHKNIGGKK